MVSGTKLVFDYDPETTQLEHYRKVTIKNKRTMTIFNIKNIRTQNLKIIMNITVLIIKFNET